jgi:hypothetical protein
MKEMCFPRKQHFFQAIFQHFKKTRNQETNHQIKTEIKKQRHKSSFELRNKSIKYSINLNCSQYGKQE